MMLSFPWISDTGRSNGLSIWVNVKAIISIEPDTRAASRTRAQRCYIVTMDARYHIAESADSVGARIRVAQEEDAIMHRGERI